MKTTIIVALTLVLMSSVAGADTKTGIAKRNTLQLWAILSLAGGETKITVTWTKPPSDVATIVVCGSTDPLTFGVASGGLNRYGEIVMGRPSGETCLIGVGTTSGPNTPYPRGWWVPTHERDAGLQRFGRRSLLRRRDRVFRRNRRVLHRWTAPRRGCTTYKLGRSLV